MSNVEAMFKQAQADAQKNAHWQRHLKTVMKHYPDAIEDSLPDGSRIFASKTVNKETTGAVPVISTSAGTGRFNLRYAVKVKGTSILMYSTYNLPLSYIYMNNILNKLNKKQLQVALEKVLHV